MWPKSSDSISSSGMAAQLIFILEAPLLNGIANQDDYLFEGKRLLDEIEGAKLCGSDSGLDRAVTGNHDDRRWPRRCLQAAQRFKAVHSRKPHVQQNDFEFAGG